MEIGFGESIKITGTENTILLFTTYYREGSKKLIKYFKYKKPGLAKFWGGFVARFWLRYSNHLQNINQEKIIISSIPLSPKKEKLRGFNQSELIAKHFYKSLKSSRKNTSLAFSPRLLIRKKETEALYNKSKLERRKVLENCFELNIHELEKIKNHQDSTLIIIDDITTTGTTLLEAKKTIKKSHHFNKLVLIACAGNH